MDLLNTPAHSQYRHLLLAARCLLRETVDARRIANGYPGSPAKPDWAEVCGKLKAMVDSLDLQLVPETETTADFQPIDCKLLKLIRGVSAPRGRSRCGISGESSFEIVLELGRATELAVHSLAQTTNEQSKKFQLEIYRAEGKGLAELPQSDIAELEADLREEANRGAIEAEKLTESIDKADAGDNYGKALPQWMSSPEIVSQFNLQDKRAALQMRLGRWRRKHDDGWKEVQNNRPNEPTFLYRTDAILGIIDALKAE